MSSKLISVSDILLTMAGLATPGRETRPKARKILCDTVYTEASDLPNGVFPTKKHVVECKMCSSSVLPGLARFTEPRRMQQRFLHLPFKITGCIATFTP